MPKAKGKKPAARAVGRAARSPRRAKLERADPSLFLPLTEGERADALRTLLEDERLRQLAKVGRYRVITVEPLVVKPPDALAGRRLARVVIYDYAGDACVDGCVDLDRGLVCHVGRSSAQPMLSREEEIEAIAIASRDDRVTDATRGTAPVGVMHYWSLRVMDLAHRRRSAAVIYGNGAGGPVAVAVVDLIDGRVAEVVPAERW
jgi:hypothetical protein